MHTSEDQELIDAFREGDEAAMTALVQKYLDTIYNFSFRFVKREAEAEDITQETFIKVWKHIDSYKAGMNFKAWLFQIARNTAMDYFRKKKIPVFSQFETVDGDNVVLDVAFDESLSSLEQAIKHEDVQHIERAMQQLSPQYQEVIALRYQDELTFESIGEVLGRPPNTVKSQARRALHALKDILEKSYAPK